MVFLLHFHVLLHFHILLIYIFSKTIKLLYTVLINKFLEIVDIDDRDKNNLFISAVLHDIGRGIDNNNHRQASSLFAMKYLEDKLDKDDIDVICNIINNHSWRSEKNSLLENILCFCDKIDFSCSRLENNYRDKYGFVSVLEHIKDICFFKKDNCFVFRICTDGSIVYDDFISEKENYDIGLKYNVSVISNVLGLNSYKIYFDDVLIYNDNKIFEIENNIIK